MKFMKQGLLFEVFSKKTEGRKNVLLVVECDAFQAEHYKVLIFVSRVLYNSPQPRNRFWRENFSMLTTSWSSANLDTVNDDDEVMNKFCPNFTLS